MSDPRLGASVGIGRTSEVFAFGEGSVVKVPSPEVPHDWPLFEAGICRAVHDAGLPAPEVRDIVDIDGRPAVVFEHIEGQSMWHRMLDTPADIEALAHELAEIQRLVLSAGMPDGLPDFVDRLVRRIRLADALEPDEQDASIELVSSLPRGAALLHGDLHPGNVLMSPVGPIVIDWFDAAIGHPIADIVRSSILMRPGGSTAPGHLPGATQDVLNRLHHVYVEEFADDLAAASETLGAWQSVAASGRLSEGAEVDEHRLIDLRAAGLDSDPPAALAPTTP